MKVCSICNQTYADNNLNYCLKDGGTLTSYNDERPPTVMFERACDTQQNWIKYQHRAMLNQPLQPVSK
jgi:hypothetical protein